MVRAGSWNRAALAFGLGLALVISGDVRTIRATASKGSACFANSSSQTRYYSVRWSSGNANFVLKAGETHRLNDMDDSDTVVCWDTKALLNSCPNEMKIVVGNCQD